MPIVGLAEVLVEPVFSGTQRQIGREIGPVVKGAGRDAGKAMGAEIAKGLAAETPAIEAEVAKYGKALSKAEDEATAARKKAKAAADAEAKALGALRVAQEKLQESYATGSKKQAQEMAALTKKVEEAQRQVESSSKKVQSASDKAARSLSAMTVAQQRLSELQEKGNATQSQLLAANDKVNAANQRLLDSTNALRNAQVQATAATQNLRQAEENATKGAHQSAAGNVQVTTSVERLNEARIKANNIAEARKEAEEKLAAATKKVERATQESVGAQTQLQTHLKQVRAEVERNGTAWERLSHSVRSIARGRPLGEWTGSVTKDSAHIGRSMDNLAHQIENSGTRGGRAFTRGFMLITAALTGVVPLAGAASSALLGVAAAATTLASSFQQLGGVAALIPAAMVTVAGVAGTLKAAFSGIGEALQETIAVDDRIATMGQNPRIMAMAVEDAMDSIVRAEENAADARLDAARRVEDAQRALQDTTRAVAEAQQRAARMVESAERRVVEVARRVVDAQRELQRVVEQVAESREDAARSVELAQRQEVRAAREVADAQRELAEARAEAQSHVREAGRNVFDADRQAVDAALAYEEANRAYREAVAEGVSGSELAQINNNVAKAMARDEDAKHAAEEARKAHEQAKKEAVTTNREIEEAERRLEDARLAQLDAIYARKEAEEDAARAARDGAEQIVSAQQNVTDAMQDQTDALRDREAAYAGVVEAEREGAQQISDAQRDVADAVAASARQQRDAARSIEAAQRSLERVQLQQADSAGQAGEKAALAMGKLTPAAQLAATALLGVYERLQNVQRIAQENFFSGLVEPLEMVADTVIPQLEVGVGRIATALSGAAEQFMISLNNSLDQGVLESLLTSVANVVTLLTPAIDPLVQAFVTLAGIGMPYMEKLATWIADSATEFNEFIQTAAADGSLKNWIDLGIAGFQDLGRIFSNTMGIFSAWNEAARAGGIDVTLDSVANALGRLREIMEGPVFQDTMATIFTGAREGMEGLAEGGRQVADAFVKGADAFAEFQRLGGEITGMFVGGVFQALSNPEFGSGLTSFLENVKIGVGDMVALMPGLSSAFGRLLESFGPIVQELGPTLVEVFTFFADSIANVLSFFQPLLTAIAGSPHIIGLLIAAFVATAGAAAVVTAASNVHKVATAALWVVTTGLSIAQGALAFWLGRSTAAFATNKVALATHLALTKLSAAHTWLTVAATTALAGAQRLLNAAIAAHPLMMILVAIGLVVGALVYFFTQTELGREIWKNVWGFITETAQNFAKWWTEEFWPGLMKFLEELPANVDRIGQDMIKGLLNAITGGHADEVLKAIEDFGNGIIQWFKDIFGIKSPSKVFQQIGHDLINGLVNGINDLIQKVVNTWNNMLRNIRNAFEYARLWLTSKILEFQARWHLVWTTIRNKVREVWDNMWANIRRVFTIVVNWVRDRIQDMRANWDRNWKFVGDTIGRVWKGIQDAIRGAWNFIKDKIINPMIEFVRTKIPEAFEKTKDAIKRAWDKIKEIAKTPVDFVVKTIINKGLIGGINNILPEGLKIDPVPWPPKGWRKGGYTGKGNPDEEAGVVHKDEFVFNSAATNAIGKDRLEGMMHAAMRGEAKVTQADRMGANAHPYFWGNVAAIKPHGAYYMDVAGGMSEWNFPGAAKLWDGASGLRVKTGRGKHQGYVRPMDRGGGILGYATGTNIDMSNVWKGILGPKQRLTVAAHETGHAIGLPHDLGGRSIMAPLLHQMAATPTARDIAKLQYLYPGGSGEAGVAAPATNPLTGLVSGIMDAMKKQFPGSSMFVDIAGGIAVKIMSTVSKWIDDIKNGIVNIAGDVVDGIKNFFGMGANIEGGGSGQVLLRDSGGYVSPGMNQVLNRTGQYEYVNTPADMRVLHDIAENRRYTDGQRIYNIELPQRASVEDLMSAVNFEERVSARGGKHS